MSDLTQDPLSGLIADIDELDRQKLMELLTGYCVLSKDGQIRPITNFYSLDTKSKLLVIILAQKAARALGLADTDWISPKQIEIFSGVPGGTVRPKLVSMSQERLVETNNGNYSIPNHAIPRIILNSGHVSTGGNKQKVMKVSRTRKARKNSENLQKLLQIEQSKIGENRLNLLLKSGKYLERSLAVLAIAREIEVEYLSPAEITQFLKEKIRVNVLRENISLALGRATRYVDRFRLDQGGAYGYKIMVPGEKLLEKILTELKEK